MSDFKLASVKILKSEGGYSYDPDDSGGETYKGISRKFWPQWSGWKVIDSTKNQSDWKNKLNSISGLNDAVLLFYKINFWDKIGGDSIKNQDVANLLVDSAVNEGIKSAVKRAEEIVGLPQTGILSLLLTNKLNSFA